MAITLTDNDFFTGLSNLALVLKLYATNTSNIPESFVDTFTTDMLANGDTKIFAFSDLPVVKDYSPNSTLLTVTKVDTNEETIAISHKKQIATSYNEYILSMAFTSDGGMNQFIGYMLGQMESAKTKYLYELAVADLKTKQLAVSQILNILMFNTETMTDPVQINSAELINNKRLVLGVQNTIDNIGIYSNKYNAKKYTQALGVKDMRFIFSNPYKNESIVNLFAQLLNSKDIVNGFDRPEMLTIPSDAMGADAKNVIGWLVHKYWYQIFYKFIFMGRFFDVSNLCNNNFLTFFFASGFLDNLPAVKFEKKLITPTP